MAPLQTRLTPPAPIASLTRMNILDQIIDFFVRLVRGRIDNVQMQAKAKTMAVEARLKGEAAKRVNGAIDGSLNKAKGVVQKSPPPQAKR